MVTYKEAGVDIDAGDELVRTIKPIVRRTFTPGVLKDIGAFGAFFDLAVLSDLSHPILVSSVDGVGTKLKVAFLANRHDTVGQDLVNHCVNDIAVCGALPLFFLDYFSTGALRTEVAVDVVRGFAKACEENGCALIGGETAEMPDMYAEGEYDLAGMIVGAVDRDSVIDGSAIRVGDAVLGLPSTGLHTNGYSLARRVLFSEYGIDDTPDLLGGERVGDALLRVHRSYLKAIQTLVGEGLVNGLAHITGGGLVGNLSRIVPDGLRLEIDWSAWEKPPVFRLIQEAGGVPEDDMRRTFNQGIGLAAVVPAERVEDALAALSGTGERALVIGRITD